jgi:hypothetical protein
MKNKKAPHTLLEMFRMAARGELPPELQAKLERLHERLASEFPELLKEVDDRRKRFNRPPTVFLYEAARRLLDDDPNHPIGDLPADDIEIVEGIAAYFVSESQRKKGSRGASARWKNDGRADVDYMIKELSGERDEFGDHVPPAELWPKLYGKLDQARLNPRDHDTDYTYHGGSITYEAFRRRVQRIRNK